MRVRDLAIRKSLEIIDGVDLGTFTVDVLLENCPASKRTLEYAFYEHFGTSPANFIKSLRLAATRANLRQADSGPQSVSEIATKFGFWHLSQFAADYNKLFGELPSATLQQSKKPILLSD